MLFLIGKGTTVRQTQNKLDLNELRNYIMLDIDNFGNFLMSGTQTTGGIPAVAAAVGYDAETFGPTINVGTTPNPTTSYPQFINRANVVPYELHGHVVDEHW